MENATSESIIFSPTCILTELSLLYIGANGKSADEIHEIIGKDLSKNEIIELLAEKINRHKKAAFGIQDCTVTFANKLFYSELCEIVSEFSEILKTKLYGEIQAIDFTSKNLVAKELNKFIQKSTKNQISNAIKENEIPDGTDLALISSLHFIAAWKDSFEPRRLETFYSTPERKIAMMSQYALPQMNWNLVQDDDKEWDCLGIPYLNFKAWMYIVLPKKESSLSELIKGMTKESFDKWTQR
uniref:Serpin domain-containing protein n=1 Tax=Panagrolaimus superbus TaxID=310955 RepID=A0A914YAA0_9BILA